MPAQTIGRAAAMLLENSSSGRRPMIERAHWLKTSEDEDGELGSLSSRRPGSRNNCDGRRLPPLWASALRGVDVEGRRRARPKARLAVEMRPAGR